VNLPSILKSNTFWTCFASIVSALTLGWLVIDTMVGASHETNRLHTDLRTVLSDLNELSLRGSQGGCTTYDSDGTCLPCFASECLGGLALQGAYRDQFQLLTLQADSIASSISDSLTAIEYLELAKACYVSGLLDKARRYIRKTQQATTLFEIVFQSHVLEAQIDFFQEKLSDGNNRIRAALNMLSADTSRTDAERGMLAVQAHLACAAMHSALGKDEDAKHCLSEAHKTLQRLPYTYLTESLLTSLRDQVTTILRESETQEFKSQTFDAYVQEIQNEIAKQSAGQPVTAEPEPPTEVGHGPESDGTEAVFQ
jgi:hypothetical protein